jgi:hypothetical protein
MTIEIRLGTGIDQETHKLNIGSIKKKFLANSRSKKTYFVARSIANKNQIKIIGKIVFLKIGFMIDINL